MKVIQILNCALIFLNLNCYSQINDSNRVSSRNKYHNGGIYFDKNLDEYQIDSCLYSLLKAVVNSDRHHSDYKPDSFFHSLNFYKKSKSGRYRYLSIYPRLWNNPEYIDYTGIIKLDEMTFLCRGDFETDSLFHYLNFKKERVKLKQPKDNTFNTPFIEDPSFQGLFLNCKGVPIYIEIYIKGKIQEYEMDFQNNK